MGSVQGSAGQPRGERRGICRTGEEITGAVLVAAAVSVFVYVNSERNSSDDLFNANVYALAQQEIDPPGYVDCFSSYVEYDYITEKEYSHYVTITECMGCKDVDVVSLSKHGTCLKYPKEKR